MQLGNKPTPLDARTLRRVRPSTHGAALLYLFRSIHNLPIPPRRHPQVLAFTTANPPNAPGQVMRTAQHDYGDRPFVQHSPRLGLVAGFDLNRVEFHVAAGRDRLRLLKRLGLIVSIISSIVS